MCLIKKIGTISIIVMSLGITACGENLMPSDSDQRPSVEVGSEGHLPTQTIKDFTLTRTDDQDVVLSDYLDGGNDPADAILIYFTMWCSICAAHTGDIASSIKPLYEDYDVRYLIVDYVSGSLEDTISEGSSISDSWGLEILSDNKNVVKDQLHGGMGVTIVIDGEGTIFYNQDYGNGEKVEEALDQALGI